MFNLTDITVEVRFNTLSFKQVVVDMEKLTYQWGVNTFKTRGVEIYEVTITCICKNPEEVALLTEVVKKNAIRAKS